MNLSDDEFWNLTPRELSALFKVEKKIREREKKEADYRAGVIASTIANVFRDKKKKKQAYKPADFMPDYKQKKENKPQSWKQQLKIVEALNAAQGGKDKRGGVA